MTIATITMIVMITIDPASPTGRGRRVAPSQAACAAELKMMVSGDGASVRRQLQFDLPHEQRGRRVYEEVISLEQEGAEGSLRDAPPGGNILRAHFGVRNCAIGAHRATEHRRRPMLVGFVHAKVRAQQR